jgi:hypothetical protein
MKTKKITWSILTIDAAKNHNNKYSNKNKRPSRHQYIQIWFCSCTLLVSLLLPVAKSRAIIQCWIMLLTMMRLTGSKVRRDWTNDYLFFLSSLIITFSIKKVIRGRHIKRMNKKNTKKERENREGENNRDRHTNCVMSILWRYGSL